VDSLPTKWSPVSVNRRSDTGQGKSTGQRLTLTTYAHRYLRCSDHCSKCQWMFLVPAHVVSWTLRCNESLYYCL